MKKIVVATDFSPAALNAANYAADMALAINADLLLLNVCSLPLSLGEVPTGAYIEDIIKEAEADIAKVKAQLNVRSGGKLHIETEVTTGTFLNELGIVCDEIKPYAVIMGSQGTTAAERLLFGSHTVYAMQHLVWPLITVPLAASYAAIKAIGLACDFTKVVDTIPANEIRLLVKDFNATLHVLNTAKKEEPDPEFIFQSGLLQEMLADLNPVYHFIASEETEAGIINFAGNNHIDMLIVLPKRHNLLDKLLHKSHTKQFVLHSHVPVMALHE